MKKFYEDAEYIKMCKSASNILPTVAPTIGLPDGALFYYDYNHTLYKMDSWLFPLYRQDQLQEMIKGDFIETCDYIAHYSERFVLLKTPEKILLQIVMEENYHKKWNGEEWVDQYESGRMTYKNLPEVKEQEKKQVREYFLAHKELMEHLQRDMTEIEKRHADIIRRALENVDGLIKATWEVDK